MTDDGLHGFRFEGGTKAVTNGICVWSEPFVIKVEEHERLMFQDDEGEDLVVLLMDTQGVFGKDTSKRDCASIFALTALLSSHMVTYRQLGGNSQLFNAMKLFEEHHLEHLLLCLAIAKMHGKSKAAYQVTIR